jgi:hypothetical protein
MGNEVSTDNETVEHRIAFDTPAIPWMEGIENMRIALMNQDFRHDAVIHMMYVGPDDIIVIERATLGFTDVIFPHGFVRHLGGCHSDIHSPWGTNLGGPVAFGGILLRCRSSDGSPQYKKYLQSINSDTPNVTKFVVAMPGNYLVCFFTAADFPPLLELVIISSYTHEYAFDAKYF